MGATESLVGLLDHAAFSKRGVIKLWSTTPDKRSSYSYVDIVAASHGLASLLTQKDIQPRDRVILWGPNSPEWVTAYFGTLRSGAVVVPFDVNADMSFLSRIIEVTDPRLIIAGSEQIGKLPATNVVPILDLGEVNKMSRPTDQGGIDVARADLAEIVFTSGTTGSPKGAMLTHGNILSNVESIRQVIQLKPEHRLLSILPLSHVFETTAGLLTPIDVGTSITYPDTLQGNRLLQAIRDEKVTCMAVVPPVLSIFKKAIERGVIREGKEKQWRLANRVSPYLPEGMRRLVFSSLHKQLGGSFEFFVCGGAPLDPELADSWENFGIRVVQGYGMTEASPVVACDSLDDRDHRYTGRPLPGVDVRIATDREIMVRGPNVMLGYWMDPIATGEVLEEDWLHTGDLGVMEKGRLKILGRKKNMIVLRGGLNVYPEDIEQTLTQQSKGKLKEAVVFLKEDDRGRGTLHAVLLLDEPDLDVEKLIKEANQRLDSHQRIQGYTKWPDKDFPRTHTRKAKRDEIIAKYNP